MALVVKDRVKETTTTTGTGTITLAGAVAGFQSFSAIGTGNSTYYAIVDQTPGAWEVGIGTYTASGTTLSRTTVLASSNAGALVNFGAGTKDVFITYPAGFSAFAGGGVAIVRNAQTVTADYTMPADENGSSVGDITIASGVTVTIPSGSRWVVV